MRDIQNDLVTRGDQFTKDYIELKEVFLYQQYNNKNNNNNNINNNNINNNNKNNNNNINNNKNDNITPRLSQSAFPSIFSVCFGLSFINRLS